MKRALQLAVASLAHHNRNFRVPVIRPPRGRIKCTTSQPSLFLSLAGLTAGNAFLDDFSGELGCNSIRQSPTQLAAKLFDSAMRGQRVR
jgi:hypothetical protein